MTAKRILELTVVYPVLTLAIFGTVAVVFPPHTCPRLNANETAAIATLRNMVSAQTQFRDALAVDLDRDGRGEYGTFRELSAGGYLRGDDRRGRLDPPVLSGAFRTVGFAGEVERSGFYFRIFLPGTDGRPVCADRPGPFYDRISADGAEERWCAYAWPIEIGKGQRRLLFVNEEGVVYGSPLDTRLGRTGLWPDSIDALPDRDWREIP